MWQNKQCDVIITKHLLGSCRCPLEISTSSLCNHRTLNCWWVACFNKLHMYSFTRIWSVFTAESTEAEKMHPDEKINHCLNPKNHYVLFLQCGRQAWLTCRLHALPFSTVSLKHLSLLFFLSCLTHVLHSEIVWTLLIDCMWIDPDIRQTTLSSFTLLVSKKQSPENIAMSPPWIGTGNCLEDLCQQIKPLFLLFSSSYVLICVLASSP